MKSSPQLNFYIETAILNKKRGEKLKMKSIETNPQKEVKIKQVRYIIFTIVLVIAIIILFQLIFSRTL